MINNDEDEIMENENIDSPDDDAVNDAERQAELDPETSSEEGDDDSQEATGEDSPETPEEIQAKLTDMVADLNDRLLRALSDAENTRRIAAREKADASKYAITNFARDLLGVADNMGMALASITPEAREADANLNNLCVGIEMTMTELLGSFERNSIKPIDAEGKQFDHNLMEALQRVPNENVDEGTVVQVVRGGFQIHDRLLRPAQVLVATGGPKPKKEDPVAETPAKPESKEGQEAYESGDLGDSGANIDTET